MSDAAAAPSPAGVASAGRLLREAREKQGLHIAALAAAIKVAPKKLELLEADRFDELPDATFARALAQTVCRALKIDPSEVMRLLPPLLGHRLEQVGEGLNTPFRERPGAQVQHDWSKIAVSPLSWVTLLLVAGAVVVYLLPTSIVGMATGRSRPASAVAGSSTVEPRMPPGTAEAPAASSGVAAPPLPAAPAGTEAASAVSTGEPAVVPVDPRVSEGAAFAAAEAAPASAALAGALPAGMLQLRAVAPSWIEVSDARGLPLMSRLMNAGEAAGIDGVPPLRVRIGNASGTEVVFRGQPTELGAFTRDNVARLELR